MIELQGFSVRDAWEHAFVDSPNVKGAVAEQAMRARGFLVGVPPDAEQQLKEEVEPTFDGSSAVDLTSWRAIDQATTRPTPTAYIVDPNEWQRLCKTYRTVPPPPPDVAAHHEPFVIVR